MTRNHWFLFGAIALTSTAAIADDVPAAATPPTRATVKKSVTEAQKARQLTIGEDATYPASPDKPTKGVKLHRKAKKPAATEPSDSAPAAAK